MVTNWIIIGAVFVLIIGVVLAFRTAAMDAPHSDQRKTKPVTKGAIRNS